MYCVIVRVLSSPNKSQSFITMVPSSCLELWNINVVAVRRALTLSMFGKNGDGCSTDNTKDLANTSCGAIAHCWGKSVCIPVYIISSII